MPHVSTLALRPVVASCLALFVTLSWAPWVHADPPSKREIAQGREHANKGLEHFKSSRWAEARDHFRQALAVQETAVVTYYLGVCEEQLGDLREARRRLQQASSLAASGETGESSQARKAVLEDVRELALQVESKLPKVSFRWQPARPEGAALTVDDERVSIDDVAVGPLRLNPGEHKVKATAPGRKPYELALRLEPGQQSDVVLTLEPEAPPPAPVAVPQAPAPPPTSGGGWQRPVGYVGLGLGAALIGAGVFSSLRVSSQQDKLESDPGYVAYRQGVPRGNEACDAATQGVVATAPSGTTAVTPSTFADTCSSRDRFQTLQYVFYGAGAAFALTGAYFAFLAPAAGRKARAAQSGPSWRVVPGAGLSAASMTLRVSF
jgi:hypothetical protein